MTAIRRLGGLVSIHAGKKANSLEAIKNSPPFKMTVKTDILRDHIDILEVGAPAQADAYLNTVFPTIGFRRPVIIASDNHDIRNYTPTTCCWIRGDATFQALKHLCCEPSDRVYLGETPPQLERVTNNRTRYIRSVAISKLPHSKLHEQWFDVEVPLNHGLVAIIGNKGGGKSALADIIGLLGDSCAGEHFSFLTPNRFCAPKNNKAKHFTATITWESDGTHERPLSDTVSAELESVKYLPQEYLERICNELHEGRDGSFYKELTSVIFSHVSQSERLNCNSFEELLQYKTSEKHRAIESLRHSMDKLSEQLAALEHLSSASHIAQLSEKYNAKQRELAAHEATKPTEVSRPAEDETAQDETRQKHARLSTLEDEISHLEQQIKDTTSSLTRANRRMSQLQNP